MDGIGGQVKRRARLAALSGKKVHTVSDFIAQQDQTNVFVSEIEVEEIKNVKTMLDERWENVAVLPETQKMHSMNVFGVNAVEYGKYALCDEWNVHNFRTDSKEEPVAQEQGIAKNPLIVGNWVEVEYNDKRCQGEVVLVGQDDVQVSVLYGQFAQNWKWPSK